MRKWDKGFRAHYVKVVRRRRQLMKEMGGIMKVAAYFLSSKHIYNDTTYNWLLGIYIERELGGPSSTYKSYLSREALNVN